MGRLLREIGGRLRRGLFALRKRLFVLRHRPFAAAQRRRQYVAYRDEGFSTGIDLVRRHFETWSSPDNPTRPGFEAAVALLGERPSFIVETGSSAWGTDSTRLWDSYVATFGGEFITVDIRTRPRRRLAAQMSPGTRMVVGDSVEFLSKLARERPGLHVDLCYLDSLDLDWDDPDPAAAQGLEEWRAVAPLLGPGSVLMIDDTPSSVDAVPVEFRETAALRFDERGYLPGKGALVWRELTASGAAAIAWHGYNVVFHFPPG